MSSTEPFRINCKGLSKAHAGYKPGVAAAHARYVIRGGDGTPIGQLPHGVALNLKSIAAWLNREEKAERSNGRICERIQLSFHPCITNPAIREWMLRQFAERVGENKISWLAQMHTREEGNLHAHMILRNRDLERGAKGGAPIKWLQKMGAVERMRSIWCDVVNEALKRSGVYERVDHRSYYRQSQVECTGSDPGHTPKSESAGSYVPFATVQQQRKSGANGIERPTPDEIAERRARAALLTSVRPERA